MKFFLLVMGTVMTCLQLSGQVHNYDKFGNKIESNERVSLEIDPFQVTIETNTKESGGMVAAAILPTVIEQGLKIYKNILAAREAKFTGEYGSSASKSGFWENKTTVILPKLTLIRKLIDFDENKEASTFILTPEISPDGIAFRYFLEDMDLSYSKAKYTKNSKSINIVINIKFTAIEKIDNKYVKSEKGSSSIKIYGAKFGESKPTSMNYSGWFPIIQNYNSPNRGVNYEMEASVIEINPKHINSKRAKEFLEGTAEPIGAISKVIVESIFKTKEEDKETKEASKEKKEK